ncbi:MAG TPA: LemA family protein [Planctomycetota bacterium]|nr:LemA family protein [Planctomycetota bacterium]
MKSIQRPSSHLRAQQTGALSGALIAVVVVVGLLVLLVVSSIGSYNGLQSRRTVVEQKIAALDSAFVRRNDLIPNLVATVQGSADFEKTTLENLVKARASVGSMRPPDVNDPAQVEAYLKAQAELGGALSRLLVVAENYPDLRATEQFGMLQQQLEGTENRINVARVDWTTAVSDYNTKLRSFPGNILGGIFKFKELPQYQAQESERSVPKVDFGKQK